MIISEDDIPTFGRLQQSLTPPPSHPSRASHPPVLYLHICKHGAAFIRTYQSRSEQRGEGSHSPSGPSQTGVHNGDKTVVVGRGGGEGEGGGAAKRAREKSLVSEKPIVQSVWWLPAGAGEQRADGPSVVGRKSALCVRLNAWVPPALSVLQPTSTSSLAERNMQTHFIDFWGFAEKANWISRAGERRPERE